MNNWIEKAVEEMTHLSNVGKTYDWGKKQMQDIILSHAPVIDAEKLAEKIQAGGFTKYERSSPNPEKRELVNLITDSIDLDITWVDGDAKWGIFTLHTFKNNNVDNWCYKWWLYDDYALQSFYSSGYKSQALAQRACEQALKGIITGVKE